MQHVQASTEEARDAEVIVAQVERGASPWRGEAGVYGCVYAGTPTHTVLHELAACSGDNAATITRAIRAAEVHHNLLPGDLLDERIFDVLDGGETALHVAVLSGNAKIARELLRLGADPDLHNGEGRTALHMAVERRDVLAVQALLESGARHDLSGGSDWRTPMEMLQDEDDCAPAVVRIREMLAEANAE